MCFLITSFHLFKGNLVIFPLILAIFIFWLSQPFPSIFAYLALGLYLAVWRVPLHEDSTSYQYVVCLLQKYCIKRFTDWLIVLFRVAVVAILSIFYFWFAKVGWGGGGGVAKTSLYSFSVRLNGYISTLSVVFQQQQINDGVLNYLPSE